MDGDPPHSYDQRGDESLQAQPENPTKRNRLMTITKPFEVIGNVCGQTGSPDRRAQITVRIEPAELSEFVNAANAADFEQRFADAALDGIRVISQKYPWLTFRFTVTEAQVHPVDSNEDAFRLAGQEAAKAVFKQIYKELTITANNPRTKIIVSDTEGNLVQAELGRMQTSLLQGDYDVFFGGAPAATRIHLQENMALQEGR